MEFIVMYFLFYGYAVRAVLKCLHLVNGKVSELR